MSARVPPRRPTSQCWTQIDSTFSATTNGHSPRTTGRQETCWMCPPLSCDRTFCRTCAQMRSSLCLSALGSLWMCGSKGLAWAGQAQSARRCGPTRRSSGSRCSNRGLGSGLPGYRLLLRKGTGALNGNLCCQLANTMVVGSLVCYLFPCPLAGRQESTYSRSCFVPHECSQCCKTESCS